MATRKAAVEIMMFKDSDAAIFDTVVKQRNENYGEEPFIYSIKKGLEALKKSGKADELGIGIDQIRDSIHSMANNRILNADWIVERKCLDPRTYKFAFHDPCYMYNTYCGETVTDSEEEEEDRIFIDVTYKRIKDIRDNCIPKYQCALTYDDTEKRFVVKCKELGVAYIIKRINYGAQAAEVLRIALAESPNPVTRGDLKKKDINVMKISIATRVFDDNSVARNELKSFVKLTSSSITVHSVAVLTLAQIRAIAKASF